MYMYIYSVVDVDDSYSYSYSYMYIYMYIYRVVDVDRRRRHTSIALEDSTGPFSVKLEKFNKKINVSKKTWNNLENVKVTEQSKVE